MRCAALVVAVGALVAGCASGHSTHRVGQGGQPTNPAGAATSSAATTGAGDTTGNSDTCSMLTTDQVAAALGEPAAPGKPEPNFDTPECEWDAASGHNGTVTLDVGPWVGDPGVKPMKLGAPVSGVGDEAYSDGTGLYVRKGNRGFRIWVFNVTSQSTRLDLEQQLATALLAKV